MNRNNINLRIWWRRRELGDHNGVERIGDERCILRPVEPEGQVLLIEAP